MHVNPKLVPIAGCFCDECIKARTKAKVQQREGRPYIERRGGEIGTISVRDALKQRRCPDCVSCEDEQETLGHLVDRLNRGNA